MEGNKKNKKNTISNTDSIIFEKLLKIVRASDEDINNIFKLYKKYINPNLKSYKIGCGCSNDILVLYNDLMDFYIKNIKNNNKNEC